MCEERADLLPNEARLPFVPISGALAVRWRGAGRHDAQVFGWAMGLGPMQGW